MCCGGCCLKSGPNKASSIAEPVPRARQLGSRSVIPNWKLRLPSAMAAGEVADIHPVVSQAVVALGGTILPVPGRY
jgi:hypothetical protein